MTLALTLGNQGDVVAGSVDVDDLFRTAEKM